MNHVALVKLINQQGWWQETRDRVLHPLYRCSVARLSHLIGLAFRSTRLIMRSSCSPSAPPKHVTWPSPVGIRDSARRPRLSQFAAPLDELSAHALIRALDTALHADVMLGTSRRIEALMQEMCSSHAMYPIDLPAHQPPQPGPLDDKQHLILLFDESTLDPSFGRSKSTRQKQFANMVAAARAAHPDAHFLLARSTAVDTRQWLSDTAELSSDVEKLPSNFPPGGLFSKTRAVYTVSAHEGMLALILGVPVHVFGTPYYAGWGLTRDYCPQPQRSARPSLNALFEVMFVRFSRYIDPYTHRDGTLDTLLDCILLQRLVTQRFSELKSVAGIRFQWWKRPFATPFLTAGGGGLRWTNDPKSLNVSEHAALWGARTAPELPEGIKKIRIEDGFIHSTGLGSDILAPRSQVIDTSGIYFDPTQANDLTKILNQMECTANELARATALREQIVKHGLTKYNLGRRAPMWSGQAGKPVVLVIGQVADDASIRLGTRTIRTAEKLLEAVRASRRTSFIVYKPHPDVLSGNRRGLVDAEQFADIVDTHADTVSLIEKADEVHTLSSLAGFDALLRGKRVFTYGLPFYAGWGLTSDALAPLPWRERTLSLDMLVAGVLLRYPIYWDWKLRLYTSPEAVISQLAGPANRPLERLRGNRKRPFVKSLRWIRNVFYHLRWQYEQRSR